MLTYLSKNIYHKICHTCLGVKLNKEILNFKICNQNIIDIYNLQINHLYKWLYYLYNKNNNSFINNILFSLIYTIKKLLFLNLDNVSLNKCINYLSTGEIKKLFIIKKLIPNLTDVIYIFDEPSIGLDQIDVKKLIFLLKKKLNNKIV